MTLSQPNQNPVQPTHDTAPTPPVSLSSADLLGGAREALIRHGEAIYRLKATNRGGLILVK